MSHIPDFEELLESLIPVVRISTHALSVVQLEASSVRTGPQSSSKKARKGKASPTRPPFQATPMKAKKSVSKQSKSIRIQEPAQNPPLTQTPPVGTSQTHSQCGDPLGNPFVFLIFLCRS
jgi:hypothetical protein